MGLLNNLIQRPRSVAQPPVPQTICPIAALLYPQFDRLGFAPGTIPIAGAAGSAWSRGYILGVACGSVQSESHIRFDDRFCFDRVNRAFAVTYGPDKAMALIEETIEERESGCVEVLDGMAAGSIDIIAMIADGIEDGGFGSGLEFYRRNHVR